jgi:uncharacterized lipoprotein YddW (UPF0748 family)
MPFLRFVIVVCLLMISGCVLTGQGSLRDQSEPLAREHGLWITRWDYQNSQDIRQAISDAASLGITDVYWQVRGQADAYYPSDKEPWGIELLKYNPSPPGFDPLKIAIDECKSRKIRIHAWVNVMPLWRGKQPPLDRLHIYHTHPEWRLRDEHGTVQALHDGYVVVNPVLDEVHDHIVGVIRDIVKRYDIDGVHLDYIRYLADEVKADQLMPGDPVSRSLYAKQTGKSSDFSKIDRVHYKRWIATRISTLVQRIERESISNKRGVRLSAAVWRRPDLASDRYLQDAAQWVQQGSMDAIMPMIYTDKDDQYRSDLASWQAVVEQRRVVPGIGVYKHNQPSQTLYQTAIGDPQRFGVFAYASLFESPNPDQKKDEESVKLRAAHRNALADLILRIKRP